MLTETCRSLITTVGLQLDEKLNQAVNDAKKEWRLKERKNREHSETKIKDLSKLVIDVEAKVEKANWELKQVQGGYAETEGRLGALLHGQTDRGVHCYMVNQRGPLLHGQTDRGWHCYMVNQRGPFLHGQTEVAIVTW